jgi:hypothetical protein
MQSCWPKEEDFKKTNAEPTMKWHNLPLSIFVFKDKKEIKTKYGLSTILSLKNRDGEQLNVWAPGRLAVDLLNQPFAEFVFNGGLKLSKKDPTIQFFSIGLL